MWRDFPAHPESGAELTIWIRWLWQEGNAVDLLLQADFTPLIRCVVLWWWHGRLSGFYWKKWPFFCHKQGWIMATVASQWPTLELRQHTHTLAVKMNIRWKKKKSATKFVSTSGRHTLSNKISLIWHHHDTTTTIIITHGPTPLSRVNMQKKEFIWFK